MKHTKTDTFSGYSKEDREAKKEELFGNPNKVKFKVAVPEAEKPKAKVNKRKTTEKKTTTKRKPRTTKKTDKKFEE